MLSGADRDPRYEHLKHGERQAVVEIPNPARPITDALGPRAENVHFTDRFTNGLSKYVLQ